MYTKACNPCLTTQCCSFRCNAMALLSLLRPVHRSEARACPYRNLHFFLCCWPQRTFDAFVAELQSADMDVNQPDSTGRLPLVEAVRTKDARFVDALLQYGALAKSKDPASGASPLHVAFQQNLIDVRRVTVGNRGHSGCGSGQCLLVMSYNALAPS